MPTSVRIRNALLLTRFKTLKVKGEQTSSLEGSICARPLRTQVSGGVGSGIALEYLSLAAVYATEPWRPVGMAVPVFAELTRVPSSSVRSAVPVGVGVFPG